MTGVLVVRGAEPHDVIVVDGRIAAVGRDLAVPAGAEVLDGDGLSVAPGFIDLQVNGAHGIDLTGEPDRMGELAALLPRYGVTAFCPTIVSSPAAAVARARAAWRATTTEARHAVPLGLHLEGPMLNPARAGAHRTAHLRTPSPEVVAGWSRAAGVRIVTLAPELPGALAVAATLVERGVIVAAGHTDATAAELGAACAAGVTMTTHLFNAMRPFGHRDAGVVGAALAGVVPFAGMIVDGIHVDPVAVAAAWRALGPNGLVLVTDAVSALGLPPGPIRFGRAAATNGPDGVRLADGTLAGSALSMDAAVRNLMTFTGCSLAEAVASATASPAAVLGDGARGVLAPGRRGDLVLLTGGGHVAATVIGGEVAWTARTA